MKIINLHKTALYLFIYICVCIIKWANAVHEKWRGSFPITWVLVIAESVQRTLNTPEIFKVRIHSGALVAVLCLDDLFSSELIIEFMLKKRLLICCYSKTQGGWVKYKTAILRSDTEVKVIFLHFSSFVEHSAHPSSRCTGRYCQ